MKPGRLLEYKILIAQITPRISCFLRFVVRSSLMGVTFSDHRGPYLKPWNHEPDHLPEYEILILQKMPEYLVFYDLLLGQVQWGLYFLVIEGAT